MYEYIRIWKPASLDDVYTRYKYIVCFQWKDNNTLWHTTTNLKEIR